MKQILVGLNFLLLSQFVTAQDCKKLLLANDSLKLEKVLAKNADFLKNQRIMQVNNYGDTAYLRPLIFAHLNDANQVIDYLLNHPNYLDDVQEQMSETFIHSLSQLDNTLSNRLYELGADPNYHCEACRGNNGLMVAVSHGNEEWYSKLKKTNDWTYKNKRGVSVLHCAASGPSTKIATEIFGSKKFDLNDKTIDGMTALDYAAWNSDNHALFEKLLVQGADINQAQNILEAWPFNPNEAIFQENIIFLRRDDLWTTDEEGMIPVLWAAMPDDDGNYSVQQVDLFNRMLDLMLTKEQLPNLKQLKSEAIYYESIAHHLMNAFDLRGDYAFTISIYDKFLSLVEYAEPNVGWTLLDKKDYKRACKMFGQEKINELYDKHALFN